MKPASPVVLSLLFALSSFSFAACGSRLAGGPPEAPSSLAATLSGGDIVLAWTDNSDDEAGFRVERSVDSDSSFAFLATVAKDTATYTDVDIASGTVNSYRVCAFDGDGESDFSNTSTLATGGLGLTANSDDDSVTFFDARTLSAIGTTTLGGAYPWQIALSTDGSLAYVVNRDSADISIVSFKAAGEVGSIPLSGSTPSRALLAPDGYLYVCFLDEGFIARIDVAASTPAEAGTIGLAGMEGAAALAVTPDGEHLYVSGDVTGTLVKIDLAEGEVEGSFTYGMPSGLSSLCIDGAGLCYLGSGTMGELLTWDTNSDTWASSRPTGMMFSSIEDMVLRDGLLFAAAGNEGGLDYGALTVIDAAKTTDDFLWAFDDDGRFTVSFPFTFPFDGTEYLSADMSSDGFIDFTGSSYGNIEFDVGALAGFGAIMENLDSGDGTWGYSSRSLADHAIFQWCTATNSGPSDPNTVSVFEIVLFADGRARFDYLMSMPDAVNEDDGYIYGVGDGSGTALVDMRAGFGSPFSLERRSFLWDPATPGAVTEVPFTWEGTGAMQLPLTGSPHGVAVTWDSVFIPFASDFVTGSSSTTLQIYDRATLLPSGAITVGEGPRAVAIQP